jgi:hypothetical protein
MQYRELGKSVLKLPTLSYGASSLGNEFRQTDEAEGIRSLHGALDNGNNFIDTSPYYGRTLSEKRPGKAFKQIRAKNSSSAPSVAVTIFPLSTSPPNALPGASTNPSSARASITSTSMQCHDIEFVNMAQIV